MTSFIDMAGKDAAGLDGRTANYVYMPFNLSNNPPSSGTNCHTKLRGDNARCYFPSSAIAQHVHVVPCSDMFYICERTTAFEPPAMPLC